MDTKTLEVTLHYEWKAVLPNGQRWDLKMFVDGYALEVPWRIQHLSPQDVEDLKDIDHRLTPGFWICDDQEDFFTKEMTFDDDETRKLDLFVGQLLNEKMKTLTAP